MFEIVVGISVLLRWGAIALLEFAQRRKLIVRENLTASPIPLLSLLGELAVYRPIVKIIFIDQPADFIRQALKLANTLLYLDKLCDHA